MDAHLLGDKARNGRGCHKSGGRCNEVRAHDSQRVPDVADQESDDASDCLPNGADTLPELLLRLRGDVRDDGAQRGLDDIDSTS